MTYLREGTFTSRELPIGSNRQRGLDTGVLPDSFEQLGRFDFESMGQLYDVQDSDVTFSSLDAAHVVSMEIGQFRQFFL